MTVKFLKRNFLQRLFGLCATPKPADGGSWQYESGLLTLQLGRLPELSQPGSAVRFEGGDLPRRVLVVHAEDGTYHALHNRCTHGGHRRLDFVPGTETVQCCSVNKSTFGFAGDHRHGPVPEAVTTFPVEAAEGRLNIRMG